MCNFVKPAPGFSGSSLWLSAKMDWGCVAWTNTLSADMMESSGPALINGNRRDGGDQAAGFGREGPGLGASDLDWRQLISGVPSSGVSGDLCRLHEVVWG